MACNIHFLLIETGSCFSSSALGCDMLLGALLLWREPSSGLGKISDNVTNMDHLGSLMPSFVGHDQNRYVWHNTCVVVLTASSTTTP